LNRQECQKPIDSYAAGADTIRLELLYKFMGVAPMHRGDRECRLATLSSGGSAPAIHGLKGTILAAVKSPA